MWIIKRLLNWNDITRFPRILSAHILLWRSLTKRTLLFEVRDIIRSLLCKHWITNTYIKGKARLPIWHGGNGWRQEDPGACCPECLAKSASDSVRDWVSYKALLPSVDAQPLFTYRRMHMPTHTLFTPSFCHNLPPPETSSQIKPLIQSPPNLAQ